LNHFCKRGYSESTLQKIRDDVRNMNRGDLLIYKKRDNTNRIAIVLPFHHKFKGIQHVLQRSYKKMLSNYPDLKSIFPQPPLISYRRAPNIRDKLVHANHTGKNLKTVDTISNSRSFIHSLMNHSGQVTNTISRRSSFIEGGSANTVGAIYSAECTKHKKLYIGQTIQTLNARFNGHRSDMEHYPERSDLSYHFRNNDCDMKTDLQISVLEKAYGSSEYMKHKEDKWIMRLKTHTPLGLITKTSEFGFIYKSLFYK